MKLLYVKWKYVAQEVSEFNQIIMEILELNFSIKFALNFAMLKIKIDLADFA